jgi:hypothetical protein
MDESKMEQYRTYADNIMGTWYNKMREEMLVFSFLYGYTKQSDVLITEGGIHREATYSIQNGLEDE